MIIGRGGSRGEVAEHFWSIIGLRVRKKPRKTNPDIEHHVNISLIHLDYFVKKKKEKKTRKKKTYEKLQLIVNSFLVKTFLL